ncbi:MAG TPA: flagellar hook-associated protein FlgK [Rhodanobacteraceae bacterium]|nr:flagellar hook-associated protein FlgK [Rhodanobacteraceae bacterium]
MADLLNTGVSGLLAARTALDTVSNNITNADTPGYSMQTVNLQAAPAENAGNYSIGTGVAITGITRAYNQYLVTAARTQNSALAGATSLNTLLGDTNNLFGGSANLQTALDAFYSGVQTAANDPSSVPVRQALLGQATSLANTFHTLAGQLDTQASQVNQEVAGDVGTINGLAGTIATLNQQIVAAYATGTTPNDLLDQRDQALRQLSSQVGVNVYAEGNSVNVSVGSGTMLVSGTQAYALSTAPNAYDASQTDVFSAQGTDVSGQLTGGDLGGALAFRTTVLAPTQDQLGAAALAFTNVVNAQQAKGMTLTGALGSPLFSVANPTALAASGNTGGAGISASVTDPGALTGQNYVVTEQAGALQVTTMGGTPVTGVTGTGAAGDPLTFNGLSLTLSGTPANGDSFEILPTRSAADTIQVAITNPNDLALAAPVVAQAGASNTGATVGGVSVLDPTNPDLLASATVRFASPTTYTVNGGAAQTLTGSTIQQNGWSLALAGTPVSGDTFTVGSNAAGVTGDNSNALALGNTATQGVLNGGTTSAAAAYAALVAANGDLGQQAETDLTTQTALSQQATQAEQSVSGVNLDQAAANLVMYQQSYQASAQVIQTANTIFNALLNAIQ